MRRSTKSAGCVGFWVLGFIVALIGIALVCGIYFMQYNHIYLQTESTVSDQPAPAQQTTNIYTSSKGVKVVVYFPTSNSQLNSPVTVMGEVPGNWSFEGSFPVEIVNSSQKVIAQSPAQLLGNWMTDKLVPFSVQLTYSSASGDPGQIVLKKDNPSGLPANDDTVVIPVRL